MPHYVALLNFTEQGIRAIKETPKRAKAFRELAQGKGVTVKDLYWTAGQYDLVVTMEGPSDEAIASLMLALGALGNVRSQTLRAFTEAEIPSIVAKV